MLLRCYPKVTDFIYHFFNQSPAADFRFIPIYSYGFWVAMGFFAAATMAVIEMRRREQLGLLAGQEQEVTVGEAPSPTETLVYFLFSFVVFAKLLGLFAYKQELMSGLSIADYLQSAKGSLIGGLLGGAAMAYYQYNEKKKQQLPKPERKKITIYPSDGI
ncbi:MAG TPA: hypothetical protein PLW44_17160, partial [Chitinophagales bacterium]|nr:hypothetical protein [Chitinophagales bacterium]